jgi:hypothetical protein
LREIRLAKSQRRKEQKSQNLIKLFMIGSLITNGTSNG